MNISKLRNYGDVLTVEEVQKVLGIGRNSVYMLLKSGELKSKKIGKRYIIPKSSLVDFLKL